jgi:hypothetical protein
MYSIPPENVELFWKNRWEQCSEFNYERVNFIHPVKKFSDQELIYEIIVDFMDQTELINIIKKRGNLSALVLMITLSHF